VLACFFSGVSSTAGAGAATCSSPVAIPLAGLSSFLFPISLSRCAKAGAELGGDGLECWTCNGGRGAGDGRNNGPPGGLPPAPPTVSGTQTA
jgi:hypothetical protein